MLEYAKKWRNDLQTDFPDRIQKSLAIDLNGRWVLVTRYLRPLKPPEEFLQNTPVTEEIMRRLARFVSLIPAVPDIISFPGIWDIWTTCDQFMDMLMGDEEEHAVLLCNFFLYLGRRAAVLLGKLFISFFPSLSFLCNSQLTHFSFEGNGIPEGSTAYVIVSEYAGEEASVWNPMTGEKFSVRDSFLPLNSVGCVITPENV